jgi:SAM-dependent methyltransferase
MSDYELLAEDYDYLHPKEEIFKQEPFFKELIKKYAIKTCLDCACGTGWHLFMLDSLGIKCYGSDLSSEMLSVAKINLKGRDIPLKKEDFRQLSNSWKTKFDAIICMTTSFPHMLTDSDVMAALQSMYEQLNEGGLLIIDNGISDSMLNDKPKFIPARILKDRAFYFFLEYPNPNRIDFNILEVKRRNDAFEHSFESIQYNAMRKADVERYLAKTKFKKIDYLGDYDFSEYSTKNSKRLIVVSQK